MAKRTRKKIKTSRYWTRTCDNCGFEYPNWFVQCPKCKETWDVESREQETEETVDQVPAEPETSEEQKTVRIIAQLAEDDVKISSLTIYFSGDNGVSWFQMPMVRENDYFVAEIQDVPIGSTIVYYLKGVDEDGEDFVENNDEEFFYYYVTDDVSDDSDYETGTEYEEEEKEEEVQDYDEYQEHREDEPIEISAPTFAEEKAESTADSYDPGDSDVIFTPLNKAKKERNLKECPSCGSKVKKDWAVCPICGHQF